MSNPRRTPAPAPVAPRRRTATRAARLTAGVLLTVATVNGCGPSDGRAAEAPGAGGAERPLGLAYLPGGPTRSGEEIRSLVTVPGGRLAAVQGGDVLVWTVDEPAGVPLELHGAGSDLDALAVADDGRLTARDQAGQLLAWDLAQPGSGPATGSGPLAGSSGDDGLWAGAIETLDNGLVVVARADGTVEVRRPDQPDDPPLAVFTGHRAPVRTLTVLDDGRVASGDADGVIHVWPPRHPDDSMTFTGHRDAVTALAETADARMVSASLDGTVQVWDPSDLGPGRPTVVTLDERPTALAVLDDGRLAVGTTAGSIRLLAAPGPGVTRD